LIPEFLLKKPKLFHVEQFPSAVGADLELENPKLFYVEQFEFAFWDFAGAFVLG
jgi:hypothetical protein